MQRLPLVTSLTCSFALSAAAIAATTIIDLGTVGGPDLTTGPGSAAYAVGAGGTVVGLSVVSDLGPDTRAFRWNAGLMTALDPLPGDEHSIALDLCAGGTIVGQSFVVGALSARAVSWSPGSTTPTPLGDFEPRAINCNDLIVGRRILLPGAAESQAVLYEAGVLTDIPTLGGPSNQAEAINGLGDVVGSSATASGAVHAFLLPGSEGAPVDLGTLGGASSHALAVNDARQVVGFSDTSGGLQRAFVAQIDGADQVASRVELPALSLGGNSYAYAINADGAIVGTSDSHAVLWDGGVVTDLNDLLPPGSGWQLRVATSISDDGDIAGIGRHNGKSRAFLLVAPPAGCAGDVDGNGSTDVFDFGILASNFATAGHAPFQDGDLDGDGDVDVFDFGILASNFGCTPAR